MATITNYGDPGQGGSLITAGEVPLSNIRTVLTINGHSSLAALPRLGISDTYNSQFFDVVLF